MHAIHISKKNKLEFSQVNERKLAELQREITWIPLTSALLTQKNLIFLSDKHHKKCFSINIQSN